MGMGTAYSRIRLRSIGRSRKPFGHFSAHTFSSKGHPPAKSGLGSIGVFHGESVCKSNLRQISPLPA
jgi:hypothetical protein